MTQNAIELFILRARRVLNHSLLTSDRRLLQRLHDGEFKIQITKNTLTGETSQLLKATYPKEEQLESLAARLRPLILGSDEVHYEKVLTEIEFATNAELLNQYIEPISWWKDRWKAAYNKPAAASSSPSDIQAYRLITDAGTYNDVFLMDRWLYGDLVHADDLTQTVQGIDIEDRFRAAAHSISRIAIMTEATYYMILLLREAGLLSVNPTAFNEKVSVQQPDLEQRIRAYSAPVGTEMPTDTNTLGDSWTNFAEEFLPST
ncbi:hypothetical protein ACLB3A_03560 [Corynebacterium freneyi]|uniref:Uncharacterized protein n=2 Tax=Corynebacterium TaxID=1716 RepID=A0ABS4U9E7_9CORY|nr:hypothetical protein [Corynebacterium freneyi]KAA8727434.1 hypothetical protein F4V54_10865 [Corynebacterium tuscaniense]MBP2333163.1 hypothetical protein [Corynebacterium freneyi]QXA52755.1 hypothetical protein I6L56_12185 [Corynebacterium freneyi]WJZ04734.1 hypothetical protein CFREN_03780 [Corynebacterium freneyi]